MESLNPEKKLKIDGIIQPTPSLLNIQSYLMSQVISAGLTPKQAETFISAGLTPKHTNAEAMLQYHQQAISHQQQQALAQKQQTQQQQHRPCIPEFSHNYLTPKSEIYTYNEPVMSTVFTDRGLRFAQSSVPPSDLYKPKILLPQYDNLLGQIGNHSPPISPPQPDTSFRDPGAKVEFTKDVMRRYLQHRKKLDKEVIIRHAKVAQKSYKNEKRFFCPPPCVYLKGVACLVGENRRALLDNDGLTPNAFIGLSRNHDDMQQLHLEEKGFAAAKTLYISDSVDKRKHFDLYCKMLYSNGHHIGTLKSKRIKVISKPSKKKLSVKNIALSIPSGSRVALFNRLRSQTVSTRFLHVEENNFHASSHQWGSFAIHLVDEDDEDTEIFNVKEGYVHYGKTVKIVCCETGIAMPKVVIRKVEKQVAILDAEDPVSQLHKVAFYFKDTERMYLCLSADKIIQFQATPCPTDPNKEMINDGACWTVISTDEARYKFCEMMGPVHKPITPVPIVDRIVAEGSDKRNGESVLEIMGENFTPNLTVWLDDYECKTVYRCEEELVAQIPPIQVFKPEWTYVQQRIACLICLVRDDGLMYPTDEEYIYELQAPPSPESPPDFEPDVIT